MENFINKESRTYFLQYHLQVYNDDNFKFLDSNAGRYTVIIMYSVSSG